MLKILLRTKNRQKQTLSKEEWQNFIIYFFIYTISIGLVTTIIPNSYWIRPIELHVLDYPLFAFFTILISLYQALSRQEPHRNTPRYLTFLGGITNFLGFACPTCNFLLISILGAPFILTYFEPWRHLIGFIGSGFLLYGLIVKLQLSHKETFTQNN